MKHRIQKLLAAAGVASRRHVEEMVLQGRVSVNGRVITSLPVMVDPEADKVTVDDEPVRLARRVSAKRVYLLMNKPKSVYSTNVAQGEQALAVDLLPREFPYRVFPVGRLDADAKGLLLLTNDGELTNRLTHPRFGVSRTYRVVVGGFIKPQDLEELQKGVWLADPKKGGFKTGKSRFRIVNRNRERSVLEISLREGRNAQVRRMLAKIGFKVKELTRTKIGPLELHGLSPGQFRELSQRELRDLRASVSENPAAARNRAAGRTSRTSDFS